MESETEREKLNKTEAIGRDSKTPKGEYNFAPNYRLASQHTKRFIGARPYEDMAQNRGYGDPGDVRTNKPAQESQADYERRFRPYELRLVWNGSEPFNPEDEVIDVRLKTITGEYSADFATIKFLGRMFDKNKTTGECAEGTYFAMPGMIVVERIDERTARRTVEDMITNREIEEYFSRLK